MDLRPHAAHHRHVAGPGIPAMARNIGADWGVTTRMNPGGKHIAVVLLRTATLLGLAAFVILVIFPAALAAQSMHRT